MKTLIAASLLVLAAAFARAADKTAAAPADRRTLIEMHQKMIAAHQKMVDCLKSDKTIAQCRDEMRKDCPAVKAGQCPWIDGSCPMMGGQGRRPRRGTGRGMGSGMGRGMGMGPGAQTPPPATPPAPAEEKK